MWTGKQPSIGEDSPVDPCQRQNHKGNMTDEAERRGVNLFKAIPFAIFPPQQPGLLQDDKLLL